jgi:hypothetical protein
MHDLSGNPEYVKKLEELKLEMKKLQKEMDDPLPLEF